MIGLEPRTSLVLGKLSTLELHAHPFFWFLKFLSWWCLLPVDQLCSSDAGRLGGSGPTCGLLQETPWVCWWALELASNSPHCLMSVWGRGHVCICMCMCGVMIMCVSTHACVQVNRCVCACVESWSGVYMHVYMCRCISIGIYVFVLLGFFFEARYDLELISNLWQYSYASLPNAEIMDLSHHT